MFFFSVSGTEIVSNSTQNKGFWILFFGTKLLYNSTANGKKNTMTPVLNMCTILHKRYLQRYLLVLESTYNSTSFFVLNAEQDSIFCVRLNPAQR